MSTFNRYVPMIIATGVGVMSGFYIWEPMFKRYDRQVDRAESKGTWNYEVVQQTRSEERTRDADAVASNIAASNVNTSSDLSASVSAPASAPASAAPATPAAPSEAKTDASPSKST
ncbi:hypothetical protein BG004_007874 [Podila humilis]|nr:hypothetical protein BG004_007874 [Podila humilis]